MPKGASRNFPSHQMDSSSTVKAAIHASRRRQIYRTKTAGQRNRHAIVTAIVFQAHKKKVAHLRKSESDHDEGNAAGAQTDGAGD
jgi:hypothetical protein